MLQLKGCFVQDTSHDASRARLSERPTFADGELSRMNRERALNEDSRLELL